MARDARSQTPLAEFPKEPIQRVAAPLAAFLHVEAAGGFVLLAFTVAALALANSPWSAEFLGFWKTPVGLQIGDFDIRHSLRHWINDGLMALFFFVVGLEVKRELVAGELRDPRRAALPIAAALGGMIVPAGLYLALMAGEPEARGWGIPMATDIAFVVGCMAILGPRIPQGLRVMLLSLAIVDDVGAILVIAIGYTENLDWAALAGAAAAGAAIVALARLGVRSVGIYVVLGTLVWFGFHESGVHATIAGVILGLLTPASSWIGADTARDAMRRASDVLHGGASPSADLASELRLVGREVVSPLARLERALHPWTAFAIMPVFAFANAGVPVALDGLSDPVALAVGVGLVIGKPVGVLALSGLAVALGLARLPQGVGWPAVAGGGLLAGIGFTMAIFIAGLALDGAALDAAKLGVLAGSVVAAVAGLVVLVATLPAPGGVGEREGEASA